MATKKFYVFKAKGRRQFLGLNPDAYNYDDDQYIMSGDLFDLDILIYTNIETIACSDIEEANKRKLDLVQIRFDFTPISKGLLILK